MPLTTDPIRDRAVGVLAAIDSLQADRLLVLVDDAVTFRLGNADAVRGREAIREAFDAFDAALSSVRHDVVDVWVPEPDVAVVVAEVAYVRADGRQLTLPSCTVLRFRDRLVVDYQIYVDAGPVFAALG